MAPIKRKNDSAIESVRPEKKQKPSSAPKTSILKQEEPAFPRGGASILTPLEHKQIQIQAKQDVLFEQNTGKKAPKNDFEDDENDEDMPDSPAAPTAKAKRKRKSQDKRMDKDRMVEEQGVRIEGLSYKRLVTGSIVLGQISEINRYDLAVSLPNNLTGYVPLASISAGLTKKLEALAAEIDEIDGQDQETEIDLVRLFAVGQYLRAYVVSTERADTKGGKGKRHIELSLNPRETNPELEKKDLVVNSTLQASVSSVQDRGLIMDLGLEKQGIRGFMPTKQLGSDMDIANVNEGAVFLCIVVGRSSDGNTITLSMDPQKIGNLKQGNYLTDAPTINSFLPGTAVEMLISEVTSTGVVGKVMGLINVTADLIHSGAAASGKDLEKKYTVGTKIKGRIICTFPSIEEKKLGISLQDHILGWKLKTMSSTNVVESVLPTQQLEISSIIEQATVVKIEHGVGLLLDVGVKGVRGFVHISKVSDNKIETLSESTGPYKLGSVHKARVIGYNAMDGLFIVSMESSVIAQPFLRLEDVKVGQIVKGTVQKMIVNETGVSGIIVNIAEGITGLVPEVHLADVHLQHPERKFKEGTTVTARVLSTIPEKRQIRLTLKKTLVNTDVEPWTSYQSLKRGLQGPGTLVKVMSEGAVVQFYGSVRAFLPVKEMSESFISDPKQHFRNGQVVNVRVLSENPAEGNFIVSCKDPASFGDAEQEAFSNLKLGTSVTGNVTEKTNTEIVLSLQPSGLRASLPFEHLADGSAQKCASLAKKIRVDQVLKDLLVLSKQDMQHLIKLTSKPSLLKAASDGKLLQKFEDVTEDAEVCGFVRNVTSIGVFVQFTGELTALLLKQHMPEESIRLPDFGMRRDQTISARVLSIDYGQRRFLLTLKPRSDGKDKPTTESAPAETYDRGLSNPVDGVSTSLDDFTLGTMTKAKIVSIKETQLNVQLADAIHGRIDVSEVFDKIEEINDRKHPLKKFHSKQILPVRILGMHDSRNHRFLPITHRAKAPVFELTAKPSNQKSNDLDILTVAKVEVESSWLVYVNNVAEDCIWVNLSPNVRGRIRAMDVSDDVSLLKDLPKNFPIGSVLRAKVLKVDVKNNRLDLSARSGASSGPVVLSALSEGMVLPGRVTKVTERQIMVQLSETLSGPINLVDRTDDYSNATSIQYEKNQTLRVCVRSVDIPNKRIILTARPSRVLSSALPVKDPDFTSIEQLKVNDVVRGFVKNVADNGIFVSLSSSITAFVRVSDLSDDFIKDWKAGFEVDQLVEGRIILVDAALNHVQMSLKRSHLDSNHKPPMTFADMKVGQVVTGKVRKVEDFGVFIVVDGSANVSGLCHKTKMANKMVADPKKLYEEGDAVQAKILHINKEKKRISFGLKASYFQDPGKVNEDSVVDAEDSEDGESQNDSGDEDVLEGMNGVEVDQANGISESDGSGVEIDLENVAAMDSDEDMNDTTNEGVQVSPQVDLAAPPITGSKGLSADWTGGFDDEAAHSETDIESIAPKVRKKKRKPEIKIDKTGDLDAHGPQSTADFERLLMTKGNDARIWIAYMAFQAELSEVEAAREIAERALNTINIEEQGEKFNVWVARLNLENVYGSEDSVMKVFKEACQYNDPLEIHAHMASIYIQSSAYSKADEIFQAALKKFKQDINLYLNYADFLFTKLAAPDRARALLPRAMQSLPEHQHRDLSFKFAQLEFTTAHGDPERGRTVFETLISQWPKKTDFWNVLLDLEMKQGDKDIIRRLFERVTGDGVKLKPEKARFFFKKWLKWEEDSGDGKGQERVRALAADYVGKQKKQVDML